MALNHSFATAAATALLLCAPAATGGATLSHPQEASYIVKRAEAARAERSQWLQWLEVSPDPQGLSIKAAARMAEDGATILLHPGRYTHGAAKWPQNNLRIVGLGPGMPEILSGGEIVNQRDVWLFTGDNIQIENVDISGAHSPKYHNGAAIRHIGEGLTIRHAYLHGNDNGLMTGNKHTDSTTTIEYSRFANNGYGDGYSHNLYVGRSARLIFRFNWTQNAKVGHLLKSRAAHNIVIANRFETSDDIRTSYHLGFADTQRNDVCGNLFFQGNTAANRYVIGFDRANRNERPDPSLRFAFNTVYNRLPTASILGGDHPTKTAALVFNLWGGLPVKGPRKTPVGASLNRFDANIQWSDRNHLTLRQKQNTTIPSADLRSAPLPCGEHLDAKFYEYRHPQSGVERSSSNLQTYGAFE